MSTIEDLIDSWRLHPSPEVGSCANQLAGWLRTQEVKAGICSGCGGPHQFDTSVPSVAWNEVIRGRGKADYLCTTCIVREFAVCGRSFTAALYGDGFSGLLIEVSINGAVAHDAHETQEVNNRLRSILFILMALNDRDAHEAPDFSEWDAAWQTAREVLDAACRAAASRGGGDTRPPRQEEKTDARLPGTAIE